MLSVISILNLVSEILGWEPNQIHYIRNVKTDIESAKPSWFVRMYACLASESSILVASSCAVNRQLFKVVNFAGFHKGARQQYDASYNNFRIHYLAIGPEIKGKNDLLQVAGSSNTVFMNDLTFISSYYHEVTHCELTLKKRQKTAHHSPKCYSS